MMEEPYVRALIITPVEYVGAIMELVTRKRGVIGGMNYLTPERVELDYELPLAEVVFDFFDQLKSRTRGYASLDYETAGYRESDLVKVDILLNGQPVDAFSAIVHREKAQEYGKAMTGRLRTLIPRQLFDVPIQAAIGGRIISRETVKAKRKDVTAKCYGGMSSRKKKLLKRQKEGKKRMKMVGSVEVPHGAFGRRAQARRRHMSRTDVDAHVDTASAYVHIPFCSAVCPYCDFAVVAGSDHLAERYVQAVVNEISRSPERQALEAVYFGGGTPSHVAPALLGRLLDALADAHGIAG